MSEWGTHLRDQKNECEKQTPEPNRIVAMQPGVVCNINPDIL